jgi:hypothetical protein
MNFSNGGSGLRQVSASVGGANANANAQFQMNATGSGFHKAWGGAFFTSVNGRTAYSTATSNIKARIGTYNVQGGIQWSPNWTSDSASGSKSLVRDPVVVSALDLATNTLHTEELFDIGLELNDGGESAFADGLLHLDAQFARFHVTMNNPYLTGDKGAMAFRIEGGVVVESMGEGIWANSAPTVGTAGMIMLQLTGPNGFSLPFDLGGNSTAGYMMDVDMDGGGYAAVPEPGTIIAVGAGVGVLFLRRRRR